MTVERNDLRSATVVERDEQLRVACFLALDAMRERCGDDLPLAELVVGFTFEGERVPFKNRQKGIYHAGRQRGSAALSISTSTNHPYAADEETDDGFWYALERGDGPHSENRALLEAADIGVPLVYFLGTRPSWWRAIYPCFVTEYDAVQRRVFVVAGERAMRSDKTPIVPETNERRWTFREARVRLHQGRFRADVLTAYRDQCSICRLKEPRLLDGAHIIADAAEHGIASVTNGLSLCSIHHRAYDQNLVGVSPEYRVHVAPRLLGETDGPMLTLLQEANEKLIVLPHSRAKWPEPDRLAERFRRFKAA